jgi:ferredoxin
MPTLKIDGRAIEVAAGATLLDAARAAGVSIPTMCHLSLSSEKGDIPHFPPQAARRVLRRNEECPLFPTGDPHPTSCFVCVVQVEGQATLTPACTAPAVEGMVVTTTSPDIRDARKTALELLLSDHVGDCLAPCTLACPAGIDIPGFLAALAVGRRAEALAIVHERLPFAGVLGCICPRYCERTCRRAEVDEAISIRALHRFAAEKGDIPHSPPQAAQGVLRRNEECPLFPQGRGEATTKRIGIVGAGPAGLTAAFYLMHMGHACTVFDEHDEPGGLFRYGIPADQLPADVLELDLAHVKRLGLDFRPRTRLGRDISLDDLRRDFEAVLVAIGAYEHTEAPSGKMGSDPNEKTSRGQTPCSPAGAGRKVRVDRQLAEACGLRVGERGIQVDRATLATNLPGVFAAGEAASGPSAAVRAVAAGRLAAVAIDQFLSGRPVTGHPYEVNVRIGKLSDGERAALLKAGSGVSPVESGTAVPKPQTPDPRPEQEARRCLQCACAKRTACDLRRYASEYEADPRAFSGARRPFEQDATNDLVVYEPGKCIACGRCVWIAEAAGERLGLAFIGRGFQVRTAVPFDATIRAGLEKVAAECAAACPTGAIAPKKRAAF